MNAVGTIIRLVFNMVSEWFCFIFKANKLLEPVIRHQDKKKFFGKFPSISIEIKP